MDAIPNISVDRLARAKSLDPELLRIEFDVSDIATPTGSAIRFPYRSSAGHILFHKLRYPSGRASRDPAGASYTLYGIDRLARSQPQSPCYLVEGETDTWAFAMHGQIAVGIPGATSWATAWKDVDAWLFHARPVILWAEPDAGGQNLIVEVARTLPGALVIQGDDFAKDPCALHHRLGAGFLDAIEARIATAQPIQHRALRLVAGRRPTVRYQPSAHRATAARSAPGDPGFKHRLETARQRSTVDLLETRGSRFSRYGLNAMTRCPFPDHNDSTPSLSVHRDTGAWFCFGCGRKGGDAIDLVRQLDGRSFRDAVAGVAQ